MTSRGGTLGCALLVSAAAVAACANGGASDQGAFDDGGTGDVTTSSSGSTSGGATSSSGSSGGTASSSGSSSGGDDSGSGSEAGGDDGGGIGGDASGDDGGNAACSTSPDTCSASSTSLGSVAGDESGSPVGASGYTSQWLRLDLSEQDSSISPKPMIFTAQLTSPPGLNYDLYAYLGPSGSVGTAECTKVKGQSTNPGGAQDQVSFQWGETGGLVSNGSDDSATVMIEVRWVSGACTNTQNWSLSAHGD